MLRTGDGKSLWTGAVSAIVVAVHCCVHGVKDRVVARVRASGCDLTCRAQERLPARQGPFSLFIYFRSPASYPWYVTPPIAMLVTPPCAATYAALDKSIEASAANLIIVEG